MKIASTLLCSVLWITNFAYAQTGDDFLVTATGDTIIGKITRHRERLVKIKPTDGGQVLSFTPEQTKQFYSGKKKSRFAPIDRPNDMTTKPVFQQCLSFGKVMLYNLKYPSSGGMQPGMVGGGLSFGVGFTLGKGAYIMAQKEKYGRPVELNNQTLFKASKETRKNRLLELIKDDKELSDLLEADEDFNTDTIVEYIEAYNVKHSK